MPIPRIVIIFICLCNYLVTYGQFSAKDSLASDTASLNISLPLTLVSFIALKKPNSIELVWETAMEVNVSHFDVERSADGISWETIAVVRSEGKAHNSYTVEDTAPLLVNYYRIKQMDLDGKFTYSKVIKIQNMVEQRPIAVHPNPAKAGSTLNCVLTDEEILAGSEVLVNIYNTSGKRVYSMKTKPMMNLSIDSHTLTPGLYNIIIQGSNKIQQARVVIQ